MLWRPRVPMSRCPDVPMSRGLDVPMSRCPDVPMSRCPDDARRQRTWRGQRASGHVNRSGPSHVCSKFCLPVPADAPHAPGVRAPAALPRPERARRFAACSAAAMTDLLGLMSTISSLLCCMRPVAKPHASVGERRRVHMPPAPHLTLSDPKERVIIVGDVHGCLDELNALLGACDYTEERDTVILVGDLASCRVTCCRAAAAAGAASVGCACPSPAYRACVRRRVARSGELRLMACPRGARA